MGFLQRGSRTVATFKFDDDVSRSDQDRLLACSYFLAACAEAISTHGDPRANPLREKGRMDLGGDETDLISGMTVSCGRKPECTVSVYTRERKFRDPSKDQKYLSVWNVRGCACGGKKLDGGRKELE